MPVKAGIAQVYICSSFSTRCKPTTGGLEETTKSVSEYRLLMITYGTGNAPYLATKCLQQLAHDEDQPQQSSSGISLLVTYYKVSIKQMNPLYCNSNCVDYCTKRVCTKKMGYE